MAFTYRVGTFINFSRRTTTHPCIQSFNNLYITQDVPQTPLEWRKILKNSHPSQFRTFVTSSFAFPGDKPQQPVPDITVNTVFNFDTNTQQTADYSKNVLVDSSGNVPADLLTSGFSTPLAAETIPTSPLDTSFLSDLAPVAAAAIENGNTLHALGLGSYYTPVGWVQNALEFLHTSAGLPWWVTIIAVTIVARSAMFPFVIQSQRNSAKMSLIFPQMTSMQKDMREAQVRGDMYEYTVLAQRLSKLMKTEGINPLSSLKPMLVQAPIFISFFMALRKMANAPVDSMREGGILWFTDLTMSDPYYILPLLTAATMHFVVRVGADGGQQLQNSPMLKYGMLYGLPLIIIPSTMWFPSGVLVYWFSSNFFSLMQVFILRTPRVRDYFRIPAKSIVPPSFNVGPDGKKKSFREQFREAAKTQYVARDLDERIQADEARFRNAGFGPIQKTFKYDPTKPRPTAATIGIASNSSVAAQKRSYRS